jgi:ferredoxin
MVSSRPRALLECVLPSTLPTMATLLDRVPQNAAGKYYVDTSCIDCDQCRALAPDFFGRTEDGMSYLIKQPVLPGEIALVNEAMDACATTSIGSDGP